MVGLVWCVWHYCPPQTALTLLGPAFFMCSSAGFFLRRRSPEACVKAARPFSPVSGRVAYSTSGNCYLGYLGTCSCGSCAGVSARFSAFQFVSPIFECSGGGDADSEMCSSFPLGHNFPYCKFWAFFLAALTPSRAPLQRCRGFVQSLHPGRRERLWLKSERGHPWSAGCWAVDARRQIRGGFTLFLGAKERGMHDACSGPRQAHKAGNRRRGLGANEGVGAKDNGYLQSSRVPPVPTRSTNPVSHLLLDGTFCSLVFCWL